MKYIDNTVKQFSDKLAAKEPVPGGGSTAALLGVLGCGLLSMVANFTLAKKSFNGYKERAKKAAKQTEALRKKMLELIDKDIKAYEKLSKSLKKNKDNMASLGPAFKKAVTPPLKVCQYAHKAAGMALELSYVGNKSIISDVTAAIYVLDAAFEAALVNININLKYVREKKYVLEKTNNITFLHKDIKRLKTTVISKTRERMFS
jgi:formiminotetrahydrofolate cyclodeaminase